MGARRFYACITALFFTAACAYMGAELFSALSRPRQSPAPAEKTGEALELWGLLLRKEQCISPALALKINATNGERIPAGEGVSQSALFCDCADGYEHLSPADAADLTAKKLEALMASKASKERGPKLVYGFEQYYAAFYEGDRSLSPGPCRISFEGQQKARRCEIISISSEEGRSALLIRLMLSEDSLSLRLCRAELIYP